MATLPVLETQRYREEPRKKGGRTKRIAEAFFVPGPNAGKYPGGADAFMCPAGPGMKPIPTSGRWYDVTDYLLRCVLHGDAAEGSAEQIKALEAATASPKPAPKKKAAKPALKKE